MSISIVMSDRLINWAMGNVLYMNIQRDNPLIGRIFCEV